MEVTLYKEICEAAIELAFLFRVDIGRFSCFFIVSDFINPSPEGSVMESDFPLIIPGVREEVARNKKPRWCESGSSSDTLDLSFDWVSAYK